MKFADSFNTFLRDTVNLDQTRLNQLRDRVNAIVAALESDSKLEHLVLAHIPQGSWPHRTIIKPLPKKEFDADFLLQLVEQPEWSPNKYIDSVYEAFGRHSTYASMRTSKTRCIRILYTNECHIDVVPFVVLGDGRQVIVNYDENDWEDTNPQGFTSWMQTKDDITGGDLRRIIRLLKYLRDYKGTFSVKSVILTTLVGGIVDDAHKLSDSGHYADVPTTLRSVMNDLNDWLQDRPRLPLIEDPSCPGTDFNHRWDQAGYSNFCDKVDTYSGKIDAAYLNNDPDESSELWREIFGEDFKKRATITSGRFGPAAPPATQTGRGG